MLFRSPAAPVAVPTDHLPTQEHIRELAAETLQHVMEQAQVFASAWALVGGRFDTGSAMDDAEEAKSDLRTMVQSLADLAATTVRPAAPVAVPLTDEEIDHAFSVVDWSHYPVARALERTLAKRWGVKLEGDE